MWCRCRSCRRACASRWMDELTMFSDWWRTLGQVCACGLRNMHPFDQLKCFSIFSRDHCGRPPHGGSSQARCGGTFPDLLRPSHSFYRHRRHHDHALPGCCGGGRGGKGHPSHQSAGIGEEAGGDRHRGQPSELLAGVGQGRPVPGPVPPVPTPYLLAESSSGFLHRRRKRTVCFHARSTRYGVLLFVLLRLW